MFFFKKYAMILFMRWRIRHFDRLESTSQTAKDFPVNSVIIADSQSGGRGRYGRTWESPKGNLYVSVVLTDYGYQTPLLAFVVGVSVAEALSDFGVCLKWPNDVLKDGKKLAGILLERTDDGRVIVGIGVNVASHPTRNMMYETASLEGRISVDETADRVLMSLDKILRLFETDGFSPIYRLWMDRATGVGGPVTVRLPNRQMQGIFKELSPDGALVLELPDKTIQKITAGDVFLI